MDSTQESIMEFELPIGFKFSPTEEQLLLYYLRRKAFDVGFPFDLIPDSIDVYKWEPWVLVPPSIDSGYFFIKRTKRDRAVGGQGRWKINQSTNITVEEGLIGCKKCFEFQIAGKKASTGWVMHEYSLSASDSGWALCKIKRSPRLEKMMNKSKSSTCSTAMVNQWRATTVAGSWPWLLHMPGFKFQPSDEEIVGCYLRSKILNLGSWFESFIPDDVDIYAIEPWKVVHSDEDESYFFFKRTGRSRTAGCGRWKSNGAKKVCMDGKLIGFKRSLEFQNPDKKASTGWIMHEYTVSPRAKAMEWILCRIKRSPHLEKMRKSQACGEGLAALCQEYQEQKDEGFVALHQEQQEHKDEGYAASSQERQEQEDAGYGATGDDSSGAAMVISFSMCFLELEPVRVPSWQSSPMLVPSWPDDCQHQGQRQYGDDDTIISGFMEQRPTAINELGQWPTAINEQKYSDRQLPPLPMWKNANEEGQATQAKEEHRSTMSQDLFAA